MRSGRLRPNIATNFTSQPHWINVGLEYKPDLDILDIRLKGVMCRGGSWWIDSVLMEVLWGTGGYHFDPAGYD